MIEMDHRAEMRGRPTGHVSRTLRLGALIAGIAVSLVFPALAEPAHGLVEPRLNLSGGAGAPRVALTFDACGGRTDHRILSTLLENHIPATVFVTARWLVRNRDTFAEMTSHPDLFEIENHGANHIPAIDRKTTVYGVAAAGDLEHVRAEVANGGLEIERAGGPPPRWFRGATALYTPTAIRLIRGMGYRVAGYSINGDEGARLGAKAAERKTASARSGDVIIAHLNQPSRAAGEGVAKGILDLKSKGYVFVRLSDAGEIGTSGTVQ